MRKLWLLFTLLFTSCMLPEVYEPFVAENVKLLISDSGNQLESVTLLSSGEPLVRTGTVFFYTFDQFHGDSRYPLELLYRSGGADTVEPRFYGENGGMILGIQGEQFTQFVSERGVRERDLFIPRVNSAGDTVQLFEDGSAWSSAEGESGVWYYSGGEKSWGKAIALWASGVEYRFDEVYVDSYSEEYDERSYMAVIRSEGDSHETMVPVGVDIQSLF